MSDIRAPNETETQDKTGNIPDSHQIAEKKITAIWIIPILAALIGIWLGVSAIMDRGPDITIIFETADGLTAGKTKIKFKNVEVGVVKSIRLDPNTKSVIVKAQMVKSAQPYLTDKTRFWVVRARVAAKGVSGLDTLLSGAYIGVDPKQKGNYADEFIALKTPPVVIGDTPGKHFFLKAESLGSIERDIPIYFRKFSVGRVEDVTLSEDGQSVDIQIFVRSPYDKWVTKNAKFWNSSGVDVSLDPSGIKINTESFTSIMIGGISFESELSTTEVAPAEDYTEFWLYDNFRSTIQKDYNSGIKYVLNFSDSVRGLSVGAPVEFRGIQLGEVIDIKLSYDPITQKITIPVIVKIDVDSLNFENANGSDQRMFNNQQDRIDFFIDKGARAQLKSGNILTGQLFVDLELLSNTETFARNPDAKIPEFPTVPTALAQIATSITDSLVKADKVMTQVSELTEKLNTMVMADLSGTLQQTQKTMLAAENSFRENSPLQKDLQTALREFTRTARSIKSMADFLERHPESILGGKKSN